RLRRSRHRDGLHQHLDVPDVYLNRPPGSRHSPHPPPSTAQPGESPAVRCFPSQPEHTAGDNSRAIFRDPRITAATPTQDEEPSVPLNPRKTGKPSYSNTTSCRLAGHAAAPADTLFSLITEPPFRAPSGRAVERCVHLLRGVHHLRIRRVDRGG